MKLQELSHIINNIHQQLQQQAVSAVNQSLTIRNWLVGYYIVEFEQHGEERARYGAGLLKALSQQMKAKGFSASDLSRYKQFYIAYPGIFATLSQASLPLITDSSIFATLSQKLAAPSGDQKESQASEHFTRLLQGLSFSHFRELFKINDVPKRRFYEEQCLQSTWSVRELTRQIGSLYYERSALSTDDTTQPVSSSATIPSEQIKDYYVFEFLGLPAKHKVTEQDLETALLDHIQQVILEMGEGFCFEARQKRLLLGDEYYFVDLVFYHRILKCDVLIELKVEPFSHGHMGQLNTYLNYYNDQIKQADDQAAIGLLLVTDQNKTLVNYATAGMEESIFVKNYKLKLPEEQDIKAAIQAYFKT